MGHNNEIDNEEPMITAGGFLVVFCHSALLSFCTLLQFIVVI